MAAENKKKVPILVFLFLFPPYIFRSCKRKVPSFHIPFCPVTGVGGEECSFGHDVILRV